MNGEGSCIHMESDREGPEDEGGDVAGEPRARDFLPFSFFPRHVYTFVNQGLFSPNQVQLLSYSRYSGTSTTCCTTQLLIHGRCSFLVSFSTFSVTAFIDSSSVRPATGKCCSKAAV